MARKKEKHKRTERSDGRICVQFRYNGKRYTVYGDSTAEAESNAELVKAQLITGIYESVTDRRRREKEEAIAAQLAVTPKIPTFEEYALEWLDLKRTECLKETTIRTDTIMVELITGTSVNAGRFGDIPIDQVTGRDIRMLQKGLISRVSTRTTNDAIIMVRSIYRHAIGEKVVSWNPALNIKPIRRTEERASDTYHRALTRQETEKFLKAAKTSRFYNLYVLMLHTGLRCGEACALCNSDISDKGIFVKRTVTRTQYGTYKIGSDTKTEAGRRFVPLDPEARAAIQAQQAINLELDPNVISLQGPIFRPARSKVLHSSLITPDIAKICEKAGIEKFTCHAFRATFATRAVEGGVKVKELQEILGHTDVKMTLGLYTHSNDDRKVEQLLAVNFT